MVSVTTCVDMLLLSVSIQMFAIDLNNEVITDYYSTIVNATGLVVWIGIVFLLKNKKSKIRKYIDQIPNRYLIMIVCIVLSLCIIASCIYINLFDELTQSLKKVTLIVCSVLTIMIFIMCGILVYIFFKKKETDILNSTYLDSIKIQKEYYEKLVKKNEGMKAFRHEIKNHMHTLEILSIEGDLKKIKDYINYLNEDFKNNDAIYTGNVIADYFINDAISQLQDTKKFFKYKIIGHFPEKIGLSDGELCVLMANTMNNAKEALMKIGDNDKCMLDIIIQNLNDNTIISVVNSISKDDDITLRGETTKTDKENHGYGMNNMIRIVEKNGGDIQWMKDKESVTVKIII